MSDQIIEIGTVILDTYGNPAVVVAMDAQKPRTIMMTIGSDRGVITSAPRNITVVTDETIIATTRDIARTEWTARKLRRSYFPSC